ncbi:MAG: hypothetical protein AAFY35_17095 [Pseudomonadota bacterium]
MKNDEIAMRQMLSRLIEWITLYHQQHRTYRAETRAYADIKRIAALSPHLLEDLGFEDISPQPSTAVQVWTRAGITVMIFEQADGADPLIDVAAQEMIDKL